MKTGLLCTGLSLFLALSINAQQRHHRTGNRYQVHSARHATSRAANANTSTVGTSTQVSTNSHAAYSGAATTNRFTIADPTINILNARAAGKNIPVSTSGIVGIPKHNYGFANGHVILHATGSTSFGSMTGTGGVQTGSSPGAIGTMGPGTGLNGKSPYAGSGMFGIVVPGSENGSKITRPMRLDSIK